MSDLQVIELVEGTGKSAVKGALIIAHYTGWLADGTKFDSSYDRGQPFQCVIGTGRVIKGWDQGVLGTDAGAGRVVSAMKVGGKRKLIVPAHLVKPVVYRAQWYSFLESDHHADQYP